MWEKIPAFSHGYSNWGKCLRAKTWSMDFHKMLLALCTITNSNKVNGKGNSRVSTSSQVNFNIFSYCQTFFLVIIVLVSVGREWKLGATSPKYQFNSGFWDILENLYFTKMVLNVLNWLFLGECEWEDCFPVDWIGISLMCKIFWDKTEDFFHWNNYDFGRVES